MKLMVGASAGGHANELLLLLEAAKGIWPVEPSGYVTTMALAAAGFASRGRPVHVIGECDRRKPLQLVWVTFNALRLALRERPDVIVTTGSAPLAIFCICAKLLGTKVVWIDSVAQIERMSLSGRVMRHMADLCLTQWPSVAASYGGVEYAGEVM